MNPAQKTQTETMKLETAQKYITESNPEKALSLLQELLKTANGEFRRENIWRVHELIGACYHDTGDADGAAQAYYNAVQNDVILRSQRQHYSNYLFALHYLPMVGRADNTAVLKEQITAAHYVAANFYRDIAPFPPSTWSQGDKIRLGYLAPRFACTAAANFYRVLLSCYDRNKFTVKCYSVQELQEKDGLSEEEIARRIYNDKTDILIDLGGHSEGGITLPIMAYRPAKITLSGWGWFDTTGLDFIDFLLGDAILVPPGGEKYIREQIFRLPHAFCYTPPAELVGAEPKGRAKRKKDAGIIFGCFANYMKITDEWLLTWGEIHGQIPGSRLILQDVTPLKARQKNMAARIAALNLTDGIILRPAQENYAAAITSADVILDTFPYPGGAMTAAALYVGVPVVTLSGSGYGSRFGESLLSAAGLGEFVATDRATYIQKAVALAKDEEKLCGLHESLQETVTASPLMQRERYMKDYESALEDYYLRSFKYFAGKL